MKNFVYLLGMIAFISTSCDTTQKINDSSSNYFDEPDIHPHACANATPDIKVAHVDFQEQYVNITFDKNPEEVDGFVIASYYYIDFTTKERVFPTEYSWKDHAGDLSFPFEQDLGWCKVSHLDECTFRFHLSENNMGYIRMVSLIYCLLGEPIRIIQYPKGVTPPEE